MSGNKKDEKSRNDFDSGGKNGGNENGQSALENQLNGKQRRGNERLKSHGGSESDGWVCELCDLNFRKKQDKILECDYCSKHYCIQCLDMKASFYSQIGNRPDVKWFCPKCHEQVEKNLRADREIEEKCRQFLQSFEHRIETLESQAKHFVTAEQVKELISSESNNKTNDPWPMSDSQANAESVSADVLKEIAEREKRKNNAIIFRVPEPQTNLKIDRINADINYMKDLAHQIDLELHNEDIVKVTRLGKKETKEGETINPKCRPLLVTFTNENIKRKLFQNAGKLRDADSGFRNVSIDHDMTQKEREETRALKDEAKKREDLSSGKYIFRVRGPPWNRYIKRFAKEE